MNWQNVVIRARRCIVVMLCLVFVMQGKTIAFAEDVVLQLSSPSAILMEASTGTVLYEKNADEIRSPASITKIMTLLLAFEMIESGKVKLEEEVVTSAYAKSMGGSQVFLEEGEKQTVDTMIKCITVASGNDASVALAEHIAGSEEAFVQMMNEKAAELGMNNTHFLDCCGLSSDLEHHTTARDVAIMSKELITKYPQIYNYSKIWMEDITHVTNKGSKPFTLSSTNKLLKQYQWTTGLKTGSTSIAKYCFSATASKEGVDLIAVIMGAPDFKIRFSEAKNLLEYGFAVTRIYTDKNDEEMPPISIRGGKQEWLGVEPEGEFRYLDVTGADFALVEKKYSFLEDIKAPVKQGDRVGDIEFFLQGKKIGSVAVLAKDSVENALYIDYLQRIIIRYLL